MTMNRLATSAVRLTRRGVVIMVASPHMSGKNGGPNRGSFRNVNAAYDGENA